MQTKDYIGFWCSWTGDAAFMIIGGGGSTCGRTDHGIGITENNRPSFKENFDDSLIVILKNRTH